MTNITLIAGTYQPQRCGVAHYTAHLRENLVQRGIQSTVLTTSTVAATNDDPTVQGVVKGWHLADLVPLVRAIHRTPTDLLHIQHAAGTYGFDRALFLLPLLLKLTGWNKPIVTTIHEYGWWEWQPQWLPAQGLEWLKTWGQRRGWWDREDGFLLTLSNALITTNGEAEQVIVDRLPHLKPIVHRIPIAANVEVVPVDRAQARKALRQDWGWSEATKVIAFFGFLHPVKGLETLLPAFQQVVASQPEARLLLMGGVETLALPGEQATRYWQQLQAQIAHLGLTDQVKMTGYREPEQVSRYLSGADIGVLPFNHGVTLKSGSLLALMAHQLPVIATRPKTIDRDLASDLEQNTFIRWITAKNQDELSTALIELLTQPSLCHPLEKAGYHFSRSFTWESITDAHCQIYQTVLHSQLPDSGMLNPPKFLTPEELRGLNNFDSKPGRPVQGSRQNEETEPARSARTPDQRLKR